MDINQAQQKQVNLNDLTDRELLRHIYEQQAFIQNLTNQAKQAQEALNQLNAEGQRRAAELVKEEVETAKKAEHDKFMREKKVKDSEVSLMQSRLLDPKIEQQEIIKKPDGLTRHGPEHAINKQS